jgi:peptidoglycan hydrolase CwlO-like protein
MVGRFALLIFALGHDVSSAERLTAGSGAMMQMELESMALQGKNPIRKVVTLMQDMQKELEVEGAKEKEMFEKFMCFCGSNGGDLATAIETAKASIESLAAKLKSEEAEKTQLAQELVGHKEDRATAKADLAEATSLREKEKAEFDASSAESATNIEAMGGAITTLEKATGGASFVQLRNAGQIKRIAEQAQSVDDYDRKSVIAFLEQRDESSEPASAQIIGIMKQMLDDFEANDKEMKEDEAKSASGFAELKASKEAEIEAATESIEKKTVRSGELAVAVVTTKDDLEDTTTELAETQKFASGLEEQCATKKKEWDERQKMRADEIAAISEAIGILNDDDALDVFKKSMPSALVQASVGFLQQTNHKASRKHRAQALIAEVARDFHSPQLKVILYAMNSKLKLQNKGKVQKFEEIIKMVDEMIAVLGKEQANDEKQKSWCEDEFEKAGNEESATTSKITSIEASIEETTDEIQSLGDEIVTLGAEIKALDKAVAEATQQRKQEHSEYLESMTLAEAAIQLIGKAKNRLQKFYNPSQYKEPEDAAALFQEPSDQESQESADFSDSASFVQVRARAHNSDDLANAFEFSVAPPPPPETFGAYKKNEKSGGVMGLMDMLIRDLENGNKDAEYEEKTAQADYAKMMEDSQGVRSNDMKSITDKSVAKSNLEQRLQTLKDDKGLSDSELMEVKQMISNLHASCDFIIENFDLRKEARGNEIDSLKNAKAVLSGADFR